MISNSKEHMNPQEKEVAERLENIQEVTKAVLDEAMKVESLVTGMMRIGAVVNRETMVIERVDMHIVLLEGTAPLDMDSRTTDVVKGEEVLKHIDGQREEPMTMGELIRGIIQEIESRSKDRKVQTNSKPNKQEQNIPVVVVDPGDSRRDN